MAVRLDQIDELFSIIAKYLKKDDLYDLFHELMATSAYSSNESYAKTVDRLYEKLMKENEVRS